MEEVHPISSNNLDKKPIDILKGLVVADKGFDKLWRGIEELLGQDSRTD